jgi:hypothetical protein
MRGKLTGVAALAAPAGSKRPDSPDGASGPDDTTGATDCAAAPIATKKEANNPYLKSADGIFLLKFGSQKPQATG